MNEIVFFFHILSLILVTWIALKLGKKALATLSSVMIVLANLFVTKEISLFGLPVTATDAYTIGSLLCLNLFSELASKEEAKKLANINLFILCFFILAAVFQLSYTPLSSSNIDASFQQILSTTPRIFFSSILTYILSQRLDLWIFSRLRKTLPLTLAMIFSLLISQAFDTVVFSFTALYGIVQSVGTIILFSYFIKILALVCLSMITLKVPREV